MPDSPSAPAPAPHVRPDVAAFLQYLASVPGPPVHQLTPQAARDLASAMAGVAEPPVGELAVRRDLDIPGPAGAIPARLYDARDRREGGPLLLFIHGGGWVIGDVPSYDSVCAEIARRLDVPVVSIAYRLAPENPWPAGPDDAEAAARWLTSPAAATALAFVADGLVIAGDSAGGNLTIVTAMALRDRPADLPVVAQWAIYPAADFVTHYPSYKQFEAGYLLTGDGIRWFSNQYAPDVDHWRASPMQADLAGMPPAVVTTAGLDPLRDQGRAYAAALAQAGVPVCFREAEGNIHGFISMRRAIPSSQKDLTDSIAALAALLAEYRPA